MKQPDKPQRPRWIAPLIMGLALVALIAADLILFRQEPLHGQEPGQEPPGPGPVSDTGLEVAAEYVDETHIGMGGSFLVTGYGDRTIEELGACLVTDPPMEYCLSPGEPGDLNLLTYRALAPGETIRFRYLDADGNEQKHWEFRTEDRFQVTGTYPADGGQEVPTESSIEIHLSYGDVNPDTLDQYISIEPATPLSITQQGNIVILGPRERSFPAMTTYKVTVSGDLARPNGDTLGGDTVFSFTTGPESDREYWLDNGGRPTENVLPGEDVYLKIGLAHELREGQLTTTLYRVPDDTAYLGLLRSYRDSSVAESYRVYSGKRGGNWRADLTGLTQAASFTGPAYTMEENAWEYYVVPPEPLTEGRYVATIEAALPSGGTLRVDKLIQVSDLSVYYVQSQSMGEAGEPNRLLAWIHDTETGKALPNASLSVRASNYNVLAVTDEDGLAVADAAVTPIVRDPYEYSYSATVPYNTDVYGLLTVRDRDRVFYDLFGRYTFYRPNASTRCQSYLFTDRPVYKHTDTAHVWGVLKPYGDAAVPRNLRISWADDTASQPVTLAGDGSFTAELGFASLAGDYAYLNLLDEEGNSYAWASVKLEDYVKPDYLTSAAADRDIYTVWEYPQANIAFTASYYEGTPAQGYNATLRPYNDYDETVTFQERTFSTDSAGKAALVLAPTEKGADTWRPKTVDYAIYSDDALDATQIHGGSLPFIFRDTMLLLESEGNSVTASTYQIDVSRYREDEKRPDEERLRGGAVDGISLTAELHRTYFRKIPNSERYDAINKTAVTAYEYEFTDDVIGTLEGVTENGVFTFANLPIDGYEEESDFYVEITAMDGRGLPVKESITYHSGQQGWRTDRSRTYQLVKTKPGTDEPDEQKYSMDLMGYPFGDGEEAGFYLTKDGERLDDPNGNILFCLSQNAILDHGIVSGTRFSLPFAEEMVPNYLVSGAYFDGERVHAIYYMPMVFDPSARELAIEIVPGKESYDPGTSADISFKATDKATGEPAANTTLVAAVVDEAVFAIQEQTPDFLASLYRQMRFGYVNQYASHESASMDTGGMGGGGPVSFPVRHEFEDTAAFEVLTTDGGGNASLSVPLPDNLTSWRVTALALSPEGEAGDNKNNFAVSKDFFVTAVTPPRLIVGDDLAITVRAAGRQVNAGDAVSYTARIEEGDFLYSAEGKAGDFTPIALDSLPLGDYTIVVTGEWNGKNDAVSLPISVVESGIDIQVTENLPLADAVNIDSTSYPVTLGFYDPQYQPAADILSYLSRQQGKRADQRIAMRFTMERLQQGGVDTAYLDSAALSDQFHDLTPEQSFYRLFPYSGNDPVLTAKIVLGAPEYSNVYPMWSMEDSTGMYPDPLERAANYAILAEWNNGQSSLEFLQRELGVDVYSFQAKMYLTAALLRAGDKDAALQWFDSLTEAGLNAQQDADGNPVFSIRSPDGNERAYTAAACLVAALLEHEDRAAYARWLLENPAQDDLYVLELMACLNSLPVPDESLTVDYICDGETETLSLKNGIVYRGFSREQLAGASFRSGGDVMVSARYTAPYTDAMGRDNSLLTVTKTMEPVDGGYKVGGLVKVTLTYDIPESLALTEYAAITVEDYVPTGMRFVELENTEGWYLSSRNDQRVRFGTDISYGRTVVYYARCVVPGSYIQESAFASVTGAGAWGASERGEISIS